MWKPPETAPKDRPIWVHNGRNWGVAKWEDRSGEWTIDYSTVWSRDLSTETPEHFLAWMDLPTDFEPMATAPLAPIWVTDGIYQGLADYRPEDGGLLTAYAMRPWDNSLDEDGPPIGWTALPEIPGQTIDQ